MGPRGLDIKCKHRGWEERIRVRAGGMKPAQGEILYSCGGLHAAGLSNPNFACL